MALRRTFLCAALALAALGGSPLAQSAPTELTIGMIPAENASGTVDRYTPMAEYLARETGIPVKLRVANDYAAVIEGQRAGNIHVAMYGPASFARAIMTGVKTEPVAIQKHENGATGYYSVLYVRANSPYKTVEDLKGKAIALVDTNSTSGNQAPRFFLNKAGYDVEKFFGKNFYAGSHENAVLALTQGTADVAANAWNTETDSYLTRMITKGMLKNPDGTAMKNEDFRVIFKSDLLPEGPFTVLASLPAELKAKIRQAMLDMPRKDKAAFDRLSDGKDLSMEPVTEKDYQPIIDMLRFNDDQRKRS